MTNPTMRAADPTNLSGRRPVPPSAQRVFPQGFLWGASTAAYQIEGAADLAGRGTSIWDTFCRAPGRVRGGATGDVACDHYHRLDEDLDLMSWLGLGAYRFSISWPRWMPSGNGPVSPRGADFYDRLVDGLLARGIQPWATLYHWDLPQSLQDAGGWAARDTAHRFAEYADSVCARLGDRVRGFLTINEPLCAAYLGYAGGGHAPGVQDDVAALRTVHHLLLGHGEAVAALRLRGTAALVGIALNILPVEPLTTRDSDREAARRIDGLANRVFLDPLFRGDYPVDVIADLSDITDFSHIRGGDLQIISTPLDILGENYYSRLVVADRDTPEAIPFQERAEARLTTFPAAPDGWRPRSPWPGARDVVIADRGAPSTTMEMEISPQCLPDVLLRLVSDYDCPPLLITENGAAFPDTIVDTEDETLILDDDRTDYLHEHLRACLDVIDEGVDLRGYFVWSLMDNFEWDWGYAQRFGIFYVDYDTQRRIPKHSAHYLRRVIGENALRQR
jgi:beta-glucosidase